MSARLLPACCLPGPVSHREEADTEEVMGPENEMAGAWPWHGHSVAPLSFARSKAPMSHRDGQKYMEQGGCIPSKKQRIMFTTILRQSRIVNNWAAFKTQ